MIQILIAGEVNIFWESHWRPRPANCLPVIWTKPNKKVLDFYIQKPTKDYYNLETSLLPGEDSHEAGQANLRGFHWTHHHHPTEYQKPTQVPIQISKLRINSQILKFSNSKMFFFFFFFKFKKLLKTKIYIYIRPDVESLIVPREGAEESLLERPLAPVMVVYELVVFEILW